MPAHQPFLGRILVVDDDQDTRNILEVSLAHVGFDSTTARNLSEMKQALSQRSYDAILLDAFLEDEDGLEGIPFILSQAPYTKVLIMSAHGTVELAVNAMKKGAATFISKTKNANDIVRKLLDDFYAEYQGKQRILDGRDFGIIGNSTAIQRVLQQIEQVKDFPSNVLIIGPSGTGKELVARAIHSTSERKAHRFTAINCSAIPENLLESELFGHKRGAFTDAKTDHKGIFEVCSEGTLLLDEIAEMPIELQAKLLRVIQEREVTPLGSSTSIKVNTRVVAATNRNPIEEIKAGKFREDLYYRLSVITIQLPPLSDRREDIPLLAEYFLDKLNKRFNKQIQAPTAELEARLMAYSWPGNIRELQNSIERGVILAQDNQLRLENMFHALQPEMAHSPAESYIDGQIFQQSLSDAKKHFEKEYLRQLLEVTRGNIAEMARISNRYRADIYRLLVKHGLEWDEFRMGHPPSNSQL